MKANRALGAVLAVLLLAAGMRILGAAHLPFWSDEAWNIWATDSGVPVMLERLAANHHPPAFFLALDAWSGITGDSRFALRFISIAAGMLAVALIYRIGKDHFGTAAGICAALIFATFEQPVYYGQSVRHYSWLLLGQALTLWLFLRVLRRPTWTRFIAYGASVAFVAYTMYIGLLAVAAHAAVGLLVWRAPLRVKARLAAAYLGAFTAFAPWLNIALDGALRKINAGVITGYHNSIPSTIPGMAQMIDILLGGQAALGLALIALVISRQFPAASSQLEQKRLGTEQILRTTVIPPSFVSPFSLPLITILASGTVMFVLVALVNLRVGIVSERTLSFMTPYIALTLGVGLAALSPRLRNVLTAALIAWAVLTPQHVIPRLNSDLAAQTVAEGYSPGDLVLLETGFDDMAFAYEMVIALPPEDRRVFPTFSEYQYANDAEMQAALDAELETTDRVWLVYWNVPPRMHERLRDAGFERTTRKSVPVGVDDPLYHTYPFIEVSRYVRPRRDDEALNFGGELRLLDVIAPERVPAGATFSVDLAWRPLVTLERDYTVALFLLDADGVTRLEHFGPEAEHPTTRWPSAEITLDHHELTLPPDLPPGRYTLYAVVYWYQTVDDPLLVNGERGVTVAEIEVTAE